MVFSLCDTLWGKLENFSENASEYAVQMRRKQMVVSWLTKSIEAELSVGRKHSLPETESMEKIFRHVSEGKIDLAVKCAVETSMFILFFCLNRAQRKSSKLKKSGENIASVVSDRTLIPKKKSDINNCQPIKLISKTVLILCQFVLALYFC